LSGLLFSHRLGLLAALLRDCQWLVRSVEAAIRRAAPSPVRRLAHQTGLYRIVFDVTHDLSIMFLIADVTVEVIRLPERLADLTKHLVRLGGGVRFPILQHL